MEIEDKSGQPRDINDFKEALSIIMQEFLKFNTLSPRVMLIVPTIIAGLKELIERRIKDGVK